ncbi:DUF1178 family protein [Pelagibacteraceae bacterium]|nr:DUF1178 family protein [Pelagibacteraceae bacterium]
MIKYLLKCKNKHEFESWFADSSEYEKLKKKKLINCIYCESKFIEKSIMSPGVINSKAEVKKNLKTKENFRKIKKDLLKIREFVEKNFEFVGDNFAKEVRNIHYNETKNKNIYGTTSENEIKELEEEGIELTSIPWTEKEN